MSHQKSWISRPMCPSNKIYPENNNKLQKSISPRQPVLSTLEQSSIYKQPSSSTNTNTNSSPMTIPPQSAPNSSTLSPPLTQDPTHPAHHNTPISRSKPKHQKVSNFILISYQSSPKSQKSPPTVIPNTNIYQKRTPSPTTNSKAHHLKHSPLNHNHSHNHSHTIQYKSNPAKNKNHK